MGGGRSDERFVVVVATHDLVQNDDVRRFDRFDGVCEVHQSPFDPAFESGVLWSSAAYGS